MSTASANLPRRRQHDRSEIPVSFLPEGNPAARHGYLFAIVGLIPGLGLVCGLPALVFGILGGRAAHRDEFERGMGHAYFSRLAGTFEFICNATGLALLARAWMSLQ